MSSAREILAAPRYKKGAKAYESWFLRGNHPSKPLAFWLRYTVFSNGKQPAEGELWGIFFDGEKKKHEKTYKAFPLADCELGRQIQIGGSVLDQQWARGEASPFRWELQWSHALPLLLLPERLYRLPIPKAKALVLDANTTFSGSVTVGVNKHDVNGWRGSVNHNWGSEHTHRYVWGQVAGFDGAPDVFLECATAQLKVGPFETPPLTTAVLREGSREFKFNDLLVARRAKATTRQPLWEFQTDNGRGETLKVKFSAPLDGYVELPYRNPPGGVKKCLNSKLSSAEVTLEVKGQAPRTFKTANRAAFEWLQD